MSIEKITRTVRFRVYFPQLPSTPARIGPGRKRDEKEKAIARTFFTPIRQLQYDLTRASNQLMTAAWLLRREQLPWPVETVDRVRKVKGVETIKKAGERVFFETLLYRAFAQKDTWQPFGLPLWEATTPFPPASGVTLEAATRVSKRLAADTKDILTGRKSLATFKLLPITWPASDIAFLPGGEMNVPLWAHATKEPRLVIGAAFGARDHGARIIYARIRSGEYKLGTVQLFQDHRTNHWTVAIAFTRTVEQAALLRPPCTVGIDSGLARFAQLACVAPDGTILSERRTLHFPADVDRALTRIFARKKQVARTPRPSGRGRTRALRGVYAARDAYARRVDTAVRQLAAAVVKTTQAFGGVEIHMEDLTNWSQQQMLRETAELEGKSRRGRRRFFTKWRHATLVAAVKNAAEKAGITFLLVDARNTSKTCAKCGKVWAKDKDAPPPTSGRISQSEFRCECGWEANADWNAAINIARRKEKKKGKDIDTELMEIEAWLGIEPNGPRTAGGPIAGPEGESTSNGARPVNHPEGKSDDTSPGNTPQPRERLGAAPNGAPARASRRKSKRQDGDLTGSPSL